MGLRRHADQPGHCLCVVELVALLRCLLCANRAAADRVLALPGAQGRHVGRGRLVGAGCRLQLQAVYFVFTVAIIILGARITLLTVWIGIDDLRRAAARHLRRHGGRIEAVSGAITAMVGLCLMSALTWLLPQSASTCTRRRATPTMPASPCSSRCPARLAPTLAARQHSPPSSRSIADASAAANPDRGVLRSLPVVQCGRNRRRPVRRDYDAAPPVHAGRHLFDRGRRRRGRPATA